MENKCHLKVVHKICMEATKPHHCYGTITNKIHRAYIQNNLSNLIKSGQDIPKYLKIVFPYICNESNIIVEAATLDTILDRTCHKKHSYQV